MEQKPGTVALDIEETEREWDLLEDIEEPEQDYTNSGPLDLHLYSKYPQVEEAANFLCSEIGYTLKRGIEHMKVVLLNLFLANHLSPNRWVGYSRNNNRYGTIPHRYNKQRVEVHPLVKVVDGLEMHGYIEPLPGKFCGIPGKGRCTRMKATGKLIDFLVGECGITMEMVGRYPEEEVIFLKDTKGKDKRLIDYEDDEDAQTAEMRTFLNRYNEFIQQTYIDIDYMGYVHRRTPRKQSPKYLLRLPTQLNFDMTKKKMRRIFNNGSFQQGGRFYGGFWMEMPSQLRLRLIIDLQKVVEIDFGGIHIHLLYNTVGIDYGAKMEDPYAIPGYGTTKKDRNLFKKLLLAVINAQPEGKRTGEQKAAMALQKDINFNPGEYPDQIPDLKQVIQDFKDHHQSIAKFLCTGAGYQLMYQDSCIAEYVLKRMLERQIPVLPVHDSFICPKQYADELIDVMTKGYQTITGAHLTKTKYTANVKEADEWQRVPEGDDEDYYYDITLTEDTELIERIMQVDGCTQEGYTEESIQGPRIVAPHRLLVSVPVEYEAGS